MIALARVAADRRYVRRVLPLWAAYAGLLVLVPLASRYLHPAGPLLWLLALTPAVPLSAVFWSYGRYLVEERDEYVRALEVRKALLATGFVLCVAAAWGFLETFAGAPHLPLYVVPIVWFPCQSLADVAVTLAERRSAG